MVEPAIRVSAELQTGKAAEHIACADLILQGHAAFLADAGMPYDIVVDVGSRIVRVQVKGTRAPFEHDGGEGGGIVGRVDFCAEVRLRSGWGERVFSRCATFSLEPRDRSKKECFKCGGWYPPTKKYFKPRAGGALGGICWDCRREDDATRAREKHLAQQES